MPTNTCQNLSCTLAELLATLLLHCPAVPCVAHEHNPIFLNKLFLLLLVRWEGRPKTPPFQWGAAGEVVPPHDQWLKDFDCSFWGLDKLVEPALLQQNPNFLERDLKETKDVFLQWAGALQAVFTIYQLQVGSTTPIRWPAFQAVSMSLSVCHGMLIPLCKAFLHSDLWPPLSAC